MRFGGGRNRGGYRGRGGPGGGGMGASAAGGASASGPIDTSQVHQEPPQFENCRFFATNGSCRYGESCRNAHAIATLMTINAHNAPVKSLALINRDGLPHLLSGSMDSSIKFWDLTKPPNSDPQIVFNTAGPVQSIEVSGDNVIMWSSDEALPGDQPGEEVSVVNMINLQNPVPTSIKRSEDMPYTHPLQVRSFKIVLSEVGTFVVTGGGEGTIRTWRFDPTTGQFAHLAVMEGHTRAVTCVLLYENCLWSGSLDRTIRVWDVSSGTCHGVLSSRRRADNSIGLGHSNAVSCLEVFPPVATQDNSLEVYIASGGADGELKLWRPNGELVHSISHNGFITAMKCFRDEYEGQSTIIIGFLTGQILIRSCATLELICCLDASLQRGQAVWSLCPVGKSCFAVGSQSGVVSVWRVFRKL